MNKKNKVKIDIEACKACGICISICPKKILRPSSDINKKGYNYVICIDINSCTACAACAAMCPDSALSVDI